MTGSSDSKLPPNQAASGTHFGIKLSQAKQGQAAASTALACFTNQKIVKSNLQST